MKRPTNKNDFTVVPCCLLTDTFVLLIWYLDFLNMFVLIYNLKKKTYAKFEPDLKNDVGLQFPSKGSLLSGLSGENENP